jgi:uncharacterized membrane protein
MELWRSPRNQYLLALAGASLAALVLFAYGAWRNHSTGYSYLVWNLMLAWLPLLFAIRLTGLLRHKLWSSWEALATSVLWLIFLPNSFYLISDFIHLRDSGRVDVLYDAVMFTSFVYTGVILGFSSLYLIHKQLRRRLTTKATAGWIAATLFICSAAIYLGRDLRWNSWDILTNPGGLLFDIADRLQHPASYPQMLLTIMSFFILLTSMYYLLWSGIRLLRQAEL